MPIRDKVARKDIEAETMFPPAKKVTLAAFAIAAFEHDGTDAGDIYWDFLCEDLEEALKNWRTACRMAPATVSTVTGDERGLSCPEDSSHKGKVCATCGMCSGCAVENLNTAAEHRQRCVRV